MEAAGRRMATGRRQTKKMQLEEKCEMKVFDFTPGKKELSGSEDDAGQDESQTVDKLPKKRSAEDFDEDGPTCAVGTEMQSMLERFGADISKVMQAKKKRLEGLTKNYLKGSQHKLEQLWGNYQSQRQKMTQQYSQQVSTVLQQWESDAQRTEEQVEKLNNLFRQQQKMIQQSRVVQNQKLKMVRELYDQFLKTMEEVEKSHESFLQGAQQDLRKEMTTLQKKILVETQQQEMATVRKSLQTMLF